MDLGEALIELHVASLEEVLDAKARQELCGGDLIENLLDVRSLPEAAAQQALGLTTRLSCAPCGELPVGSASAIAAVPRDLATSLCAYPLHENGETLTIAAASLLDPHALEQLRRVAGVRRVQQQVALGPRVRQAIARDYGSALDRRTRKFVARLEGNEIYHSSRAPQSLIDAQPYSELPRPTSIAPSTFLGDWADLETPSHSLLAAETAPFPPTQLRPSRPPPAPAANTASLDARAAGLWRKPQTAHAGRLGQGRGPYSLGQAQLDLERATHPEQVLQVYFGYATQFFDVTACFTVNGHKLRLKMTRGLTWLQANVKETPLDLALHPALASVCDSGHWQLVQLVTVDPRLADCLGFRRPVSTLLLPVRVRGRVSVVLLGALEDQDVGLENAAELFNFEPLVARSLEQLILQRKTQRDAGGQPSGAAQANALSDVPAVLGGSLRPSERPSDGAALTSLPDVVQRS